LFESDDEKNLYTKYQQKITFSLRGKEEDEIVKHFQIGYHVNIY
jgi:hypothetical protein